MAGSISFAHWALRHGLPIKQPQRTLEVSAKDQDKPNNVTKDGPLSGP